MIQKRSSPGASKTPKVIGRPSTYSPEIGERIAELLMDGISLRAICAQEGMPSRYTVFRWLDQYPAFATVYARARTLQADYMDDLILDEAKACTEENAQSTRVRIGAYQWRAGRLAPKKYGDKFTQEVNVQTGPDPEYLEMIERLNELTRQKRMTIEQRPEEMEK